MTPWKIGDVVRLKSGGPAMTVIETELLDETGGVVPAMVACGWFPDDGGDGYRTDEFHLQALTAARAPVYFSKGPNAEEPRGE